MMENTTAISTSYVSAIEKKKKKSKEKNLEKGKSLPDSSPYWYLYQRNFHNNLNTPEKAAASSSSYLSPPVVAASSALTYRDDYLCTITFSPINPFPFISFDLSDPKTQRLPHKSEIKLTILDYTRDQELFSLFQTTMKEKQRNEEKGSTGSSNEDMKKPSIVEVLPKSKADEKEFNSKITNHVFFRFVAFLSHFYLFSLLFSDFVKFLENRKKIGMITYFDKLLYLFPSSSATSSETEVLPSCDSKNFADDVSSISNSTGISDDNPAPPPPTPTPPAITAHAVAAVPLTVSSAFSSAAAALRLDCLILPNKHILRSSITASSVVSNLPSLTLTNSHSFVPLSTSMNFFPPSVPVVGGGTVPLAVPFCLPPPPRPPPPQLTIPPIFQPSSGLPPSLTIPSSSALFLPPCSSPSLTGKRSFLLMQPIISSPSSAHLLSRDSDRGSHRYHDGDGGSREVQRIPSSPSSPQGNDSKSTTIEDLIESKPLDDPLFYDDGSMIRSFSPSNEKEEERELVEGEKRKTERSEGKGNELLLRQEDSVEEERKKKVRREEEQRKEGEAETLLKSPVLSISPILMITEYDEQISGDDYSSASGAVSPLSEFRKEIRRILINFHNESIQSFITNMSFEPMNKEKRDIM
jgi:hypothetical protein